jgi:RNA-binding protein
MSLTENQKKHLRRLAHPLHPLVMVGNTLGEPGKLEAITKELDGALDAHELVKVRARLGDREARDKVFDTLTRGTRSELVQRIGNVGVFYRARQEKPKVILPDA